MIVLHDAAGVPPTKQGVYDAVGFAMVQLGVGDGVDTWSDAMDMLDELETALGIMPQGGVISRVRALASLVSTLRDQARADAVQIGMSLPDVETLLKSLQRMHIALSGTCAQMCFTELKERVDAHLARGSAFQNDVVTLNIFLGSTSSIAETIDEAHRQFWPAPRYRGGVTFRLVKRASILASAVKVASDMLKLIEAMVGLPVMGTLASIETVRVRLGFILSGSVSDQVADPTLCILAPFCILAPCDCGVITGQ